jgi:hypothetical protein
VRTCGTGASLPTASEQAKAVPSLRWWTMGVMIAEVYEALKEAGASEAKAKAAAEILAHYEDRFAKINADLLVIKWMLGVVIAGMVSLLVKTFVP